jgi:hypothetical protein
MGAPPHWPFEASTEKVAPDQLNQKTVPQKHGKSCQKRSKDGSTADPGMLA